MVFSGIAASTALEASPAQAISSLLGDSVNAQLTAPGVGTLLNQTQTVVDPGIEFTIVGNAAANLNLDVKASSFDIIYNLTTLGNIGFATTWVLSGLDFTPSTIITGVTLTSGNASLISSTSFTNNSVTVNLPDIFTPPASQTWSFDIQTQATPVPLETDALPVVISGLFMAGGVWFKRKRNQAKVSEFLEAPNFNESA